MVDPAEFLEHADGCAEVGGDDPGVVDEWVEAAIAAGRAAKGAAATAGKEVRP